MDQFYRLGTDDGRHWWELTFCLVLDTSSAIGYSLEQGLGHAWPPKTFFHKTQGSIPALMSHPTVTTINSSLPSSHWDNKDRHQVLTICRGNPEIKEIILDDEFILADGIEAFVVVRYQTV